MGVEVEEGGRTLKVTREMESGLSEVFRIALPAVLEVQAGLNHPRYASLKGIMAAKKKPMEAWDLAALGLDAATVGAAACRVAITALEPPPARGAGQVWTGEPAELVQKLVTALKSERKLI